MREIFDGMSKLLGSYKVRTRRKFPFKMFSSRKLAIDLFRQIVLLKCKAQL